MTQTLLSFSIGPVQDFIAAARTTRDLWTGSYLLSWLTAHAMAEVVDAGGRIILPAVDSEHVLLRAVRRELTPSDSETVLLAGLPNTFVAECSAASPAELARKVREAVEQEWCRIAAATHAALKKAWANHSGWDVRWPTQITGFWDIRIAALPGDVSEADLRRLVAKPLAPFPLQMQALGKLAAADKLIRHVPPHEMSVAGEPGGQIEPDDTRPKCSLLGSFAQMGPLPSESRTNGNSAKDFWDDAVRGRSLDGTRLGTRDRLCAVSLVKRFAWSTSLADSLEQPREARHFSDIDTICCAEWLENAKRTAGLDRKQTCREDGRHDWSGHWLRWSSPDEADEDGEERPDPKSWELIQRAKRSESCGLPPTYYAVLQLDGDGIGKAIRDLDVGELAKFSSELARFARDVVPRTVKDELGTLVYSGGDDVLALLPASRALDCAKRLNAAFGELQLPKSKATCSAAVVLAHHKMPLRLVLAAAREAEHTAKQSGRNCLAISVLKRSGEHSTTVVGWDDVPTIESLVARFRDGTTDRWAYRFRQQLHDLPSDPAVWRAELKRLLAKAESLPQDVENMVLDFWDRYREWIQEPKREALRRPTWPLSFIQLVQAASFLTRGGKE